MRSALMILLLLAPASARAADTLVVLSDPASSSYQEALDGLRAEMGETIKVVSADRPLPPGPHGVIIAFGGRAALRAQKSGAPMVVALAPTYRTKNSSMTVRIAMTPSPERFVGFLAAANVRHLLAVHSISAEVEFLRLAVATGKQSGIGIEAGMLSSSADLPRLLRSSDARVDAIWLAPDPDVVTPEIFAAVREFSRVRRIPFFSPAAGLVADEVRGELTVSFRDCGRAAGLAARELLAGRAIAKIVYPPSSLGSSVSRSTVSAVSP